MLYIMPGKKVCKTKLNREKSDKWYGAVGVACYSAGIVDWTKEELVIMDRRTRQIIATNNAHT